MAALSAGPGRGGRGRGARGARGGRAAGAGASSGGGAGGGGPGRAATRAARGAAGPRGAPPAPRRAASGAGASISGRPGGGAGAGARARGRGARPPRAGAPGEEGGEAAPCDEPGRLGSRVLAWVEGGSRVGAVAGAAACLVTGQVAFAALPLALPLAGAAAQWGRRRRNADDLPPALPPPSEAALENTLSTVRRLEGKLGGLEGSVLAAGQTAAEAARLAAESAETARSRREAQLEQQDAPGLGLRSAAAQREAETVEALARLEARLGGVEGSLGGLEVAQGEALRRMSAAVDAAVGEAGDLISSEVRAGMEPLRRLPSLLASALPPGELVSGEGLVPGAVGEARLLPEPVALSEVQLRELRADVARELGGAVERLGGGVTASDEQWEAVGRRLGSIEESIAQAAAARAPPMQSDFDGFAEEVQKVRDAAEAATRAADRAAAATSEPAPDGPSGSYLTKDDLASELEPLRAALEGLAPGRGGAHGTGAGGAASAGMVPEGGAGGTLPAPPPPPPGVLWERREVESPPDRGRLERRPTPDPEAASGAAASAIDSAPSDPDLGREAEEVDLAALSARELAERGLERLRRGRVLAAETGGAGTADALFRQAEELLEESVKRDPAYLPALGNLGNALLAHAQLKLGLAAAVQASPGAGGQGLQASVAELQKEAVDMLVMAGRHYRALLESDSGDGLAFTFWGRALALRGDIIALADGDGAAGLYTSAIEKFNQALALDGANADALLAWGHALLKLSGLEDLAEAAAYVEDARACFENARVLRPGPEPDAGLRACDEVALSRGL